MRTLRLSAADADDVKQAADILRHGGLVAFPTETVYGLGANAMDAEAVRRIFAAKDRPTWDPMIVHIASRDALPLVAARVPEKCLRLADAFFPGPLTLLLPRSTNIPPEVTAGRDTVGVRMPGHEIARRLIAESGVPIAAPSANRFGHVSPTTAEHVLADLDGRIDAVLDGGSCTVGVESTVLDALSEPPRILRQGCITKERIEEVIGPVEVYQPPVSAAPPESLPAPGVGLRHYAPLTRLVLIEGGEEAMQLEAARHVRPGSLLPNGWNVRGTFFEWGKWGDWDMLAQRLYAGLRWLDGQNADAILAPLPPAEGLGNTLRDRLFKAAK